MTRAPNKQGRVLSLGADVGLLVQDSGIQGLGCSLEDMGFRILGPYGIFRIGVLHFGFGV